MLHALTVSALSISVWAATAATANQPLPPEKLIAALELTYETSPLDADWWLDHCDPFDLSEDQSAAIKEGFADRPNQRLKGATGSFADVQAWYLVEWDRFATIATPLLSESQIRALPFVRSATQCIAIRASSGHSLPAMRDHRDPVSLVFGAIRASQNGAKAWPAVVELAPMLSHLRANLERGAKLEEDVRPELTDLYTPVITNSSTFKPSPEFFARLQAVGERRVSLDKMIRRSEDVLIEAVSDRLSPDASLELRRSWLRVNSTAPAPTLTAAHHVILTELMPNLAGEHKDRLWQMLELDLVLAWRTTRSERDHLHELLRRSFRDRTADIEIENELARSSSARTKLVEEFCEWLKASLETEPDSYGEDEHKRIESALTAVQESLAGLRAPLPHRRATRPRGLSPNRTR